MRIALAFSVAFLVAAVLAADGSANAASCKEVNAALAARAGVSVDFLCRVAAADGVRQNMPALAKALVEDLRRFGGNESLAAAAHNAGVTAVLKYHGVPPFPETKAYVARVMRKPASAGSGWAGTWVKNWTRNGAVIGTSTLVISQEPPGLHVDLTDQFNAGAKTQKNYTCTIDAHGAGSQIAKCTQFPGLIITLAPDGTITEAGDPTTPYRRK